MNRLDYKRGTPVPKHVHLNFTQDAVQNVLEDCFQDILVQSEDIFIAGCEVTTTPVGPDTQYDITAGSVFFKGEAMPVLAQTIIKLSTQVIFLVVLDEPLDVIPVVNVVTGPEQVMRGRRAVLAVGNVYPSVDDYMPLGAPRKETLELAKFKGKVVMTGGIIPYYGDMLLFASSGLGLPGTVVDGWHICNGVGGTPDMRGMTVIGATNVPAVGAPAVYAGVTQTSNIGDTMGADQHTLDEQELPAHQHPFSETAFGAFPQAGGATWDTPGTSVQERVNTLSTGDNSTTNDAIDMLQPSFAMVWIMSIV